MSSHVPSNNTFFALLTYLRKYSSKTGYSLVGVDRIGAGPDNVNTHFIEKLLNLTIKSVAKQYKEHADTVEIYTPEFMPKEIEGITGGICLKQCEYIDYQIEHPELDYETYSQLKELQLFIIKDITMLKNEDYHKASWGIE